MTPADRYSGRYVAILESRRAVYARAARRRPDRWTRELRGWERPEVVRLTALREETAAKKATTTLTPTVPAYSWGTWLELSSGLQVTLPQLLTHVTT